MTTSALAASVPCTVGLSQEQGGAEASTGLDAAASHRGEGEGVLRFQGGLAHTVSACAQVGL